jgi:hypothetical protein
MDSSHLTTEQLAELNRVVGNYLGYLNRLRTRMEQCRFPRDDKLFRLVVAAADRTHHLFIALHYARVDRARRG